jgi:hypothetical protein
MDAVERQDDHDDEVRDEQRDVEGVPTIDVVEGAVAVMRLEIVGEAFRRGEEESERLEGVQQGGSGLVGTV